MKKNQGLTSKKNSRGLVITYFGNGKGKTTAAMGTVLRACGYKKKIKIIQFIKGPWRSGEEASLKYFVPVDLTKAGRGFIGIENDKKRMSEHRDAARRGIDLAKKVQSTKDLFILVLDEVLGAVKAGFVSEEEVVRIIKNKPDYLSIILTGRPRLKNIIDASDIVSEIKEIKHPYKMSYLAKRGLDY